MLPSFVFRRRHDVKMQRANTGSVTTKMVSLHPVRNLQTFEYPERVVGHSESFPCDHNPVGVAIVCKVSSPFPAPSFGNDLEIVDESFNVTLRVNKESHALQYTRGGHLA